MAIDPRSGQKQLDVRSLQSLVGALVSALVIGTFYVIAWCFFARRHFPEVHDPKHCRLQILDKESRSSTSGRHPTARGWPDAKDDLAAPPPALTQAPAPPPAAATVPSAMNLLNNNPVGWLGRLWRVSEYDLIAYVGADVYMFLRFLRLGYWVSLAATGVGLIVLLPLHVYGGNHLRQLEALSMSNVADKSGLLWIHFVIAYFLGALVLWLLYREYNVYVDLRQRYLRCPTAQNYSLLVRDIPEEVDCHMLRPYLTQLLGDDLAKIHCVNHHRRMRYDRLVARKDEAIVRLARAVRECERGRRPIHREAPRVFGGRLGWLPAWFGGAYVDTIDTMKDEIDQCNRLLSMIKEEDETQDSVEGRVESAVVTMELIRVATAFKSIPFQQDARYFNVSEAPAPEQMLWQNLATTSGSRTLRSVLVWAVVIVAILGYTIPVAFASSLANLTALSHTRAFGWLHPLIRSSPTLTALIQGYLPPLIVAVLLSLVPSFMKYLSRLQGLPSDADCERAAIFKVYLFGLLDIFLAYTVAGSFLGKIRQFQDLIDHPTGLVELFATTLPAQSTFFMTYILFGAFNELPSELLRLGPLIMTMVRRKWLLKQRGLWDDLELLTEPKGLHVVYGFPLVVFLALLTFAVVAPLVSLFALIFFAMAYPVHVHQFLYVHQPTSHTGGTQWPIIFGCCVNGLVFMEIILIGILGLKKYALPAALLVPLLILTVAFGLHMRRAFARAAEVATLESLAQTDTAEHGPMTWEGLKKAYAPYRDDGEKKELSREKLWLLAEPYGVVTQGVFNDGQRAQVTVINATSDEEYKESSALGTVEGGANVGGRRSYALPKAGEAGAAYYGSTEGGGGGGACGKEECRKKQAKTFSDVQIQVTRRNGAEGLEEEPEGKWEEVAV